MPEPSFESRYLDITDITSPAAAVAAPVTPGHQQPSCHAAASLLHHPSAAHPLLHDSLRWFQQRHQAARQLLLVLVPLPLLLALRLLLQPREEHHHAPGAQHESLM
jgi:hypothetical protein